MGYNGLTGDIPSSIGDAKGLKILILENNKLSGNIPTEIFQLLLIEKLQLEDNELTGIYRL